MKIILCRGRSLVSKLIQWQTRSPYSHAAVYHDGTIYEAREFRGVRKWRASDDPIELAKMLGSTFDVLEIPTSLAQINLILRFLEAQIGKKYDYLMVLRFITREQEDRASSKRWFCSELVFSAFLAAGIALLARTTAWEVSPGLLARTPLGKPAYEKTLVESGVPSTLTP